VDLFGTYAELLVRWQRVHRLVGSTDPGWMVDHLMLDSLLFGQLLPSPDALTMDFGSGAGIPGIPLKIAHRGLRMVLLEPRRRRASFLAEAVRTLNLDDTRVIGLRSEDALRKQPELTGSFHMVLARCAGPSAETLASTAAFAGRNGRIVISGPPRPDGGPEEGWRQLPHPTLGPRWFRVIDCST
jgi:16S rRNA (guanine527-N7)-methyltransferase